MFLDASAIIAILSEEAEAEVLITAIASVSRIACSPLVVYEASLGLARKKWVGLHGEHKPMPAAFLEKAEAIVRDLFEEIGAVEMEITPEIGRAAIKVAGNFDRGSGHPAKLNFGDCFAYASARAVKMPLLFKGDDFAQTDIETI